MHMYMHGTVFDHKDQLLIYYGRHCGQVGYLVIGMRNVHESHIGDTFHHPNHATTPLPGFKPAKPMV